MTSKPFDELTSDKYDEFLGNRKPDDIDSMMRNFIIGSKEEYYNCRAEIEKFAQVQWSKYDRHLRCFAVKPHDRERKKALENVAVCAEALDTALSELVYVYFHADLTNLGKRLKKALLKKNFVSFASRVGKLCEHMASKDVTDEQRAALTTSINVLLDNNLEQLVTPENLGSANDYLRKAIEAQYPDASNKLGAFLGALESRMGNNYPLKTYYSYFDLPDDLLIETTIDKAFKKKYFRVKKKEKKHRFAYEKMGISILLNSIAEVSRKVTVSGKADDGITRTGGPIVDKFNLKLKERCHNLFKTHANPMTLDQEKAAFSEFKKDMNKKIFGHEEYPFDEIRAARKAKKLTKPKSAKSLV